MLREEALQSPQKPCRGHTTDIQDAKIYYRCRVSVSKLICPSFKLTVKKQKLWQDFVQKSLFFKVFFAYLGGKLFLWSHKINLLCLAMSFFDKIFAMPDTCVSVDCSARWDKNVPRSYHKFPKCDKELREKWIRAVRCDSWVPSASSKLCSDHFTEDCFTTKPKQKGRFLKKRLSTNHISNLSIIPANTRAQNEEVF